MKTLHHLRRHINVETDNLSSLIYNKIGTGNRKILIQGDSWAETIERTQGNLDMLLNIPGTQFLLAGTSSYSPSLMSAQLNTIRSHFKELPETIIAIIDQTDLGDELCRYRNLRELVNGNVVVRPSDPGEPGYYTLHSLFSKYEILTLKIPFTMRLLKYGILNKQIIQKMKTSKNKCSYEDILGVLRKEITEDDEKYWDNIFTEYINNVFSNSDTKNLIIVTHPHAKHLNGEYFLDISKLVTYSISKSKYRDKISLINFFDIRQIEELEINKIFIENDSYSHLQPVYITNYYLPEIIKKL